MHMAKEYFKYDNNLGLYKHLIRIKENNRTKKRQNWVEEKQCKTKLW